MLSEVETRALVSCARHFPLPNLKAHHFRHIAYHQLAVRQRQRSPHIVPVENLSAVELRVFGCIGIEQAVLPSITKNIPSARM